MQKTIADALHDGALRLAGVADAPRREARLLLAHVLGATQNDLIREPGRPIDCTAFDALIDRRAAHEPLALIVGHREFWSLDFLVSEVTLIPRPDSETLIEAALVAFEGRPPPSRILDLGTGTGCLLLSLLHEFPQTFGVGIDLNPAAGALARINATRLGLDHRAGFLAGDWTTPIAGRFDLIVSNPPYIVADQIAGLMPEVANHEPRLALNGGADGCDAYRTIIPALPDYLTADGVAILELGQGQDHFVEDLAQDAGLDASFRHDLAQIPRAIVLSLPNR